MRHLFVYGTLKRKSPNNPFKNEMDLNLKYISEAYVFGKLYLVDNYPGLIIAENCKVYGELYQVLNHENIIPLLDKYEDYYPLNHLDSLYIRETIICYANKTNIAFETYAYVYNKSILGSLRIKKGIF